MGVGVGACGVRMCVCVNVFFWYVYRYVRFYKVQGETNKKCVLT